MLLLLFLFGLLFTLSLKMFEVLVKKVEQILFEDKRKWINAILAFIVTMCCIVSLSCIWGRIVFEIQNEAIDAFVMGNTERVEVRKNGEVVDYHYKVIPTEYD